MGGQGKIVPKNLVSFLAIGVEELQFYLLSTYCLKQNASFIFLSKSGGFEVYLASIYLDVKPGAYKGCCCFPYTTLRTRQATTPCLT